MPLVLRNQKGAPLTNAEVDGNFTYLEGRAGTSDQAAADALQAAQDAATAAQGAQGTANAAGEAANSAQSTANSAGQAAATAQQSANAAGQAASDAQDTANAAGQAADAVAQALTTHKSSGDHDERYLQLASVVTAPAAGKTPKAGASGTVSQDWIEGLVAKLQYLQSVSENTNWANPMPLWANGQDGLWYDPSDLSTLFRDVNGAIPVTAAGQPVGLILDKHLGLARGPELSQLSSIDGAPIGGPAFTTYELLSTPTAGAQYKISFTVEEYQGVNPIGFTGGAWAGGAISITGNGDYSFNMRRTDTSPIRLYTRDVNTCNYRNITVKKIPGRHAEQATATARALLQQDALGKYYLKPDGTDDFYNISGPINLRESLIGLAAAPSSKSNAILLSSGAQGYLRQSQIPGWTRTSAVNGLPLKTRQSVLMMTDGNDDSTLIDSAGGGPILLAPKPSTGGLGAVKYLFQYDDAGNSSRSDAPFYGLVARVGPSTEVEQKQVLHCLDSLLGEETP